jgi:hypothetical protein
MLRTITCRGGSVSSTVATVELAQTTNGRVIQQWPTWWGCRL